MSWRKLFNRKSYPEFSNTKLSTIRGNVPKDINGNLFKNTVACLERNGVIRSHWFDGDGAVLKLNIQNGEVKASYKFIKTKAYQNEEKAQKFIHADFGSVGHTFIEKVKTFYPANRSNTNVLPLNDKLLTLWEAGLPYSLDLNDLETKGMDNLGGLKNGDAFSAHPKIDPDTGEIYSIGYSPLAPMKIHKCDKNGKLIKSVSVKTGNYPFLVHDCCLAGKYLVFFNLPLKLRMVPFVLRRSSFYESMYHNRSDPVEVVIIDKESLKMVKKFEVDNFFFFHFGNGYVDSQGNIVVDYCETSNDGPLFEFTRNVVKGEISHIDYTMSLVRMILDPKNGKLVSKHYLYNDNCEFPTYHPDSTGKFYNELVLANTKHSSEFINKIARFNFEKQTAVERTFDQDEWAGESNIIPSTERGPGYLLNVLYNGKTDKSDVHIMNRETLEDIAVLELPHPIPFGFHGAWQNRL